MNDPRKLAPARALRLLNTAPGWPAISDRTLREHMNSAGLWGGDGSHVDAPRLAAWLFCERLNQKRRTPPSGPPPVPADEYERHRDRMGQREKAKSRSGRDIGPIPPVADTERRGSSERSLRRFCETYLGPRFPLAWSPDHLRVIARMEAVILEGGLYAMATPRGFGKTTLVEAACTWALLYGHRCFAALLGASEPHAEGMLDTIKSTLENNDLLLADFPEVCFPIAKLERIPQRANGQLCGGRSTEMTWGQSEIVLPTIPGSKASGGIVQVAGLTGAIRGMKHIRADGTVVRPDVVIPDDPQTDESANSPTQCAAREKLLAGAVLGLAGPGKRIAGFLPCTVIRTGDMADRILDRSIHPEWQGERMRMVYSWPTAQKHWDRYRELLVDSLRSGGKGEPATAYYAKNRKAMDKGAVVQWEERKEPEELSAIQHAWNLRILRGDQAFFAEYQNQPIPEDDGSTKLPTVEEICSRLNRMRRGEVPPEASTLTMFIDVQGSLLIWLVAAWEPDFTGYVLDYGAWPDQRTAYFTKRGAKHTFATALPRAGIEAATRAALEHLCDEQLAREFRRTDGSPVRVARCLIDTSFGTTTEVAKQFCRDGRWSNVVMPSHGRFVGPNSVPFGDYAKKRGDRFGLNWQVPAAPNRHQVRHVRFDTNWWKTFVHQRLATPIGDPACITLWGTSKEAHKMFAEHMLAEKCEPTASTTRKVEVWTQIPGRDNDLLDCMVGAAVAASMEGIHVAGVASEPARGRKRVSLGHLWGGRA